MNSLDDQHIQLIRSALTAIDGLWFLEVENKFGFDKAFELDLKVWARYGPIMIKRIKKVLKVEDNNLEAFIQVFRVMSKIEGSKFIIKEKSPKEVIMQVQYCPWWENLKRANREKLVRCDIVDKEILPEWATSFNPKMDFKLIKSLPAGHDTCEWMISLKE